MEPTKKRLAEIVQWIRELKHLRTQSGQPYWTIVEMRKLQDLKVQATLICMGFAHARGRLHMRVWGNLRINGLEEQATVLEASLKGTARTAA